MSEPIEHLAQLLPDRENRRKHTPRNVGMVVDALHKVGAARSIVIDEDARVLAGNGVVEAAAEAGITKVRVVEASGDEIIAVQRRGLSESQKRDLAMYDNRAGELAAWDADQLRADRDAGLELAPWFSDNEQAAIFNERDDPEAHYRGMPEYEHEDQEAWRTLPVHFKDKADLEAFARLVGQTITDRTRSIWYPAAAIGRYADKAYVDTPEVSDLHSNEGTARVAPDDQSA